MHPDDVKYTNLVENIPCTTLGLQIWTYSSDLESSRTVGSLYTVGTAVGCRYAQV